MVQIIIVKQHRLGIQIELDSGERLVLTEALGALYQIQAGMSLDTTLYQQLKDEAERLQCQQKAYAYLAMRDRSIREMELYLKRKRFSAPVIRDVMASLHDAGYLDDYRYARNYITNRNAGEVVGHNLIKSELSRKGVGRGVVSRAFKDLPPQEIDVEAVYERALKKYLQLEGKKNRLEKVMQYLQRKGFDLAVIRAVARRLESGER